MPSPDIKTRLVLDASLSASEDPEKVAGALLSIIGKGNSGELSLGSKAELVTDDPAALVYIRDQLRDRHIRSAARRQMLLNLRGGSTSIMLNRQAAAIGVIALCGSPEESPLGPIYLKIQSENMDRVVDFLTAYTG
jgi:uncharacterized protein